MKNKYFMCLLLYVITSICVAKNAFSQSYTGPYATGMGGAGRASVNPLEAAFLNPANLGFVQTNYFFGFYQKDDWQGLDRTQFGVAALDVRTSALFPGALTYTQSSLDIPTGKMKIRNYELSLARKEYEKASFGLTIKRQEIRASNLEDDNHDLNLGFTFAVHKNLGLAFVAYNAIEADELYAPRKYAIGSYYLWDTYMKLALDMAYQKEGNPNRHVDVMSGIALPFGTIEVLLGYAKLSTENEDFFTSGLVWNGPRLSIAYGFKEGSKETKTHNIDFSLFF